MSFEKNGQKHIDKLAKQKARLIARRAALLGREKHECNCTFCKRKGTAAFSPAEKKRLKDYDEKIAEIDDMIIRVKRHCEAVGIKVEVSV